MVLVCPWWPSDSVLLSHNIALVWINRTQSKLELDLWQSSRLWRIKKVEFVFFINVSGVFSLFLANLLTIKAWPPTGNSQHLSLNLLQIHLTSALCSSSHPLIDETRHSCCSHCRLSLLALLFFLFKFVATSCFCSIWRVFEASCCSSSAGPASSLHIPLLCWLFI